MVCYDRIDISKGTDPGNSINNKEYMLSVNISYFAIITITGIDYHCTIHDISKSEAIYLLENSELDDRGHM